MFLPDVNFWVALAFPVHGHHSSASAWFTDPQSSGVCHFCRFTQLGFLRLANNVKVLPQAALTQDQAWRVYDQFLAHPRVRFAVDPANVDSVFRTVTNRPQYSPNVWNDAYLAAFAQTAGFEIVTFDRGFAQYGGVGCTVLS